MQLDGQMLLYRGLADADWEVEASAYRRIRASSGRSGGVLLRVTFQGYNDATIR